MGSRYRLAALAAVAALGACWSPGAPSPTTPARPTVPVTVTAPPDAAVATGTGGVAGVITEPATGVPLHNAVVELRDASGKVGTVNTDADGRYRFETIVAGDYQLVVGYSTADGAGSAQRPVTVREAIETIDIKLPVQPR